MNGHIDAEQLLGFFDASLDGKTTTDVAEHLHACDDCMRRFDAHSQFEAAIARTLPLPPELARRLRERTQSTLRAAAVRTSTWRRWMWSMAAAGLLTAASLWALAGDDCAVVVHRERAAGTVRGGDEERLHLDVTVAAPAWLAVFSRHANGRVLQMLPHIDPTLGLLAVPQPLPTGVAVRVPGAELFDFAIDPAAPPIELVLVFGERAFDATALRQLGSALAGAAPGTLPSAIVAHYPLARTISLPKN